MSIASVSFHCSQSIWPCHFLCRLLSSRSRHFIRLSLSYCRTVATWFCRHRRSGRGLAVSFRPPLQPSINRCYSDLSSVALAGVSALLPPTSSLVGVSPILFRPHHRSCHRFLTRLGSLSGLFRRLCRRCSSVSVRLYGRLRLRRKPFPSLVVSVWPVRTLVRLLHCCLVVGSAISVSVWISGPSGCRSDCFSVVCRICVLFAPCFGCLCLCSPASLSGCVVGFSRCQCLVCVNVSFSV